MRIFKQAFKEVRANSDEIYKAFGFKHLSDATQYYLHPNNQSFKGATILCQPIGEAISLFSLLLMKMVGIDSDVVGDVYVNENNHSIKIHIIPPDDWRNEGVIPQRVYEYRTEFDGKRQIKISALTRDGLFIRRAENLYLFLPAFLTLLAYEMYVNDDMTKLLFEYVDKTSVDTFVNIHEDFYQRHISDDYDIKYGTFDDNITDEFVSLTESYKVVGENRKSLENNIDLSITPFKNTEFPKECRQFVPSLGEEFVISNSLLGLAKAVKEGDVLAVLFHGPAGTGKTMNCKLICQEINMPVMETINCTENLDEFVLGKYIPVNNQIVFMESMVTSAIRYGGAVVFEEINFAKPQYLSFLNSLLDDNGFVRLDNGEVVKRHKNFRFFATMNFGYFGTKELNQALYNRFNTIVEVAMLSDESIKRMLEVRVPECIPYIEKMISVYHKIQKKIETEELDVVISPRNLESWARMAKYEGYIKAAEKTIIPIAKCDRVLEETMRAIIILYQWQSEEPSELEMNEENQNIEIDSQSIS